MKTTVDGIDFRSRTEAAWYLVLRAYGLDPVYEPETFELCTLGTTPGQPDHRSCWYMPDFEVVLDGRRVLVEVKADSHDEHEDIAKACILGYRVPMLIIVGWPLFYRAVVIDSRHKGSPAGWELVFRSTLKNELAITRREDVWLSASMPDESWLEMCRQDVEQALARKWRPPAGSPEGDIARAAWNATQWKP